MENLDEFFEMLKDNYKLDNNACQSLEAFAKNKEQLVTDIKVEDGVSSSYGYIRLSKVTESNTVSCTYAFHTIELKLADRTVVTTQTNCRLIPIGQEEEITKEKGT